MLRCIQAILLLILKYARTMNDFRLTLQVLVLLCTSQQGARQ